MKLSKLMSILDYHVPFSTAESWDNVGLLIGDENQQVNGILTALDCTEEVVDQAIDKNINIIIAHHPLIFKGIKNIVQTGYGKIIRKLIQNDINLIAMHTNLDVNPSGVNKMLADTLDLNNVNQINQRYTTYYKVQTFIPKENVENFKDQLNQLGLAKEENYEYCFFESSGKGQFKPVGEANPYLGQLDSIEYVDEIKLEFIISENEKQITEQAIINYHPYETPVYDFIKLQRQSEFGLGIIGELPHTMTLDEFSSYAKEKLNINSLRYTGNSDAVINKVAMIGGSGIGFEYEAHSNGADVFVTGDIKHHDALDAKIQGVNLLDINHYSEYVMKQGLKLLLEDWLFEYKDMFPIEASNIDTDPFTYK